MRGIDLELRHAYSRSGPGCRKWLSLAKGSIDASDDPGDKLSLSKYTQQVFQIISTRVESTQVL